MARNHRRVSYILHGRKFGLRRSSLSISSFRNILESVLGKFNDLRKKSNGKTHICTLHTVWTTHSHVNFSFVINFCLWKMNKFKILIVHAAPALRVRVSSFGFQRYRRLSSCMMFPNELTRHERGKGKKEEKQVLFPLSLFLLAAAEHSTTENFITTIVKCVCRFFFCRCFHPLVSSATSTHSHPEIVPLICTHEQPRRAHNHIHI